MYLLRSSHFCIIICILLSIVSCNNDTGVNPNKSARISQLYQIGEEVFSESEDIPDISLKTISGESISLSDFKDKKLLVLNFWASWCLPCVKELPSLSSLSEKISSDDFSVVTVNIDSESSRASVIQLINKIDFKPLVLIDPELNTVEKFSISAFPETFIISEGKFRAIYDPVSKSKIFRFKGERDWSSNEMISIIKDFIKK